MQKGYKVGGVLRRWSDSNYYREQDVNLFNITVKNLKDNGEDVIVVEHVLGKDWLIRYSQFDSK